MLTRDEVVAQARLWIDTPYSHQGRERGKKVDCLGLIVGLCDDFGIPHDAPRNYVADPKGMQLLEGCEAWLQQPADPLKPVYGGIGVFWGWNRHEAQHFAVFGMHAHRLTMIHAFSRRGKVVEHSLDQFWAGRLVRVFEFPGTQPL